MKQKITFFLILILSISTGNAQTFSDTTWTRTMGGTLNEPHGYMLEARVSMMTVPQGDIYVLTNTKSSDGWLNAPTQNQNAWLIKMNAQGDTLWTSVFGGSGYDAATSIAPLPDGGCAVAGFSQSNDGDFPNNHDADLGRSDGFIVRFDAAGNKLWSKLYGGSSNPVGGIDQLYDIIVNPAGELVCVGRSSSINGDLPVDFSKFVASWFLSVNATTGAIIESRRLAGPGHDENNLCDLYKIENVKQGEGYITVGTQTENFSNTIWTVRLAADGTKMWETKIGSNADVLVKGIWATNSGGAVLVSNLQYVATENTETLIGGYDIWVFEIDATGTIIQQSLFGGTSHDIGYGIISDNEGGYYIPAHTISEDIYPTTDANFGAPDFLLLHLNSALDTTATYRMGGSDSDVLNALTLSPDANALYMAGYSSSSDGFLHQNYGGRDVWVAKFWEESTSLHRIDADKMNIYPNPTKGTFTVEKSLGFIEIYNALGRKVFSKKGSFSRLQVDVSYLPKGLYFVKSKNKKTKILIN